MRTTYSRGNSQSQDSFSLTTSYTLRAKTPNKAKDDSGVTERATGKKPVRRRRRKERSPSALARSRIPGKAVSWKTRFGFARRETAGF